MNLDKPCVFFVIGPTAVGKTELADYLYQHLPVTIISVDSATIYRDMDIGTAKPITPPHRLINICNPSERYSAAQFCQDAKKEIAQAIKKRTIPLLIGGTGLYFWSLEHGLSNLPDADWNFRNELEDIARRDGWQALHAKLAEIDPRSACRISISDKQRIQRALELYHLTKIPWSELCQNRPAVPFEYPLKKIVLIPEDRELLRKRMSNRLGQMLERGLINEVLQLKQQWQLSAQSPSMCLIGYRQVWQYLFANMDYEMMQEKILTATYQLAKRQITWCRRFQQTWCFDPLTVSYAKILDKIKKVVCH